jgi:diaminopimelate decarboxylase
MKPKELLERYGSPLYIYEAEVIRARCRELKEAFPVFRLYYACKANTNPEVVRLIHEEGFGIECVSPGEIEVAWKVGVPIENIAFTCGSIHENELVEVAKTGIRVHLDSLTQVEQFGRHFSGKDLPRLPQGKAGISVRLNLGVGAGHHSHVITGGVDSKFGIDESNIEELKALAKKYNLKITGLHQHIGSNILDVQTFLKAMDVLFDIAQKFEDLKYLDFGGGFGVPYNPGENRLDLKSLGNQVSKRVEGFAQKYGRKLEMSFEPGRYLVAESGTLLVTVVDIKRNSTKTFVGVDSGMGHLIRPAMYDSYHTIDTISRPNAKKEKVTIAGFYCESGDVLAKDREIAMPEIGDILAIRNAGAYGYSMSSDYNLRPRPAEVLLDDGAASLIRNPRIPATDINE